MFSDHDEMSPLIAVVSALSAACSKCVNLFPYPTTSHTPLKKLDLNFLKRGKFTNIVTAALTLMHALTPVCLSGRKWQMDGQRSAGSLNLRVINRVGLLAATYSICSPASPPFGS